MSGVLTSRLFMGLRDHDPSEDWCLLHAAVCKGFEFKFKSIIAYVITMRSNRRQVVFALFSAKGSHNFKNGRSFKN